ncbi:MAG: hypothetical protein KAU20_07335 [Nanoarchaeota archaeon]|nr:hypothetical protein [Nanoarchaeota archaeon]
MKIILMVFLALLGIFLVGRTITGFMVFSQTCCFPSEGCDDENMCTQAKTELMSPTSMDYII